jgi:hypothetical protein
MAESLLLVRLATSLNWPACSSGCSCAHTLRFSLRVRFRKMKRSIAIARPSDMISRLG